MVSIANKRLLRELERVCKPGVLPTGIELVKPKRDQSADIELRNWEMDIRVFENPLYADQVFRLQFVFSDTYPIACPEVVFKIEAGRSIPIHPHVYSNGYICLDLLSHEGWSPVQNVESCCVSIQSMLAGNTKAERPPGDDEFVRTNRQRPRDVRWAFHDHTV